MTKLISMSVYGNNPRYIIGAKRQIELAKQHYPDWNIRIYTDNIKNFQNDPVELVPILDGGFPMFHRFYPMFESSENITMVRDSDSRITIREKMCIDEWLNSDKIFHTFKDHDAHFEFPIIGCAFALKGQLPDKILEIMERYMNQHKFYLSDQFFLRDCVYPLVKNSTLLHSMNEPGWFADTRKLLKNKYSFCGNGYTELDQPLYPDSLTSEIFDPDKFIFDGGLF